MYSLVHILCSDLSLIRFVLLFFPFSSLLSEKVSILHIISFNFVQLQKNTYTNKQQRWKIVETKRKHKICTHRKWAKQCDGTRARPSEMRRHEKTVSYVIVILNLNSKAAKWRLCDSDSVKEREQERMHKKPYANHIVGIFVGPIDR